MASYTVLHERPKSFYELYERKGDLQEHTHYCPGCGHGIATKLIAKAIDDLGIRDRVVLVNPVGCSVFGYYYLDVGNVQAAHGRASAVASAWKRSRPEAIVLSYQGDGDLAAIGSAEILHAANRGEPITVFFINNSIYGMTGGQMAPTTLIGQKSTTSPFGRNEYNEGFPLRVCELLASLQAPVYLERVALGNSKQIQAAARAIRKGLETQVKGLGFSLVEILSPCPTIWKLKPTDAQTRVREELASQFPVGVYRDRTKEAGPRPAGKPAPPLQELPRLLDIDVAETEAHPTRHTREAVDHRIKVAGFGGQGVLMLGEVLAEAGLDESLEVSWLPSYGPEMRSGTSNCHVRLGTKAIDSPLVAHPTVLLAMNEPSLHKFHDSVEPGGWVLYNADSLPAGFATRSDLRYLTLPYTKLADRLGEPRVGNIVMLGALLEVTNLLTPESVDLALRKHVKTERWLSLDRRAIAAGRDAARAEHPASMALCEHVTLEEGL
jgi:2-oxoisovalerate ferredoxin oxidoreductase beta subunit